MAESFPGLYEATYGEGTAWEGSPVMLLTLTLTLVADRPRPDIPTFTASPEDPSSAEKSRRRVLLPGGIWADDVPVFDGSLFKSGMSVTGPAVIDEHDTTLFVPPGWQCRRDLLSNYTLERSN
jgi:N-methylhydantoinase A